MEHDVYPGQAGFVDLSFERDMDDLRFFVADMEKIAEKSVLNDNESRLLNEYMRGLKLRFPKMAERYGKDYEKRHGDFLVLMARIEALTPIIEEAYRLEVLRHIDEARVDFRRLFDLPQNAAENVTAAVS